MNFPHIYSIKSIETEILKRDCPGLVVCLVSWDYVSRYTRVPHAPVISFSPPQLTRLREIRIFGIEYYHEREAAEVRLCVALTDMGIPYILHGSIARQLRVNYSRVKETKEMLLLYVTIDITRTEELQEGEDSRVAFSELSMEDDVMPSPASKLSIDGLERLVLNEDGTERGTECVICIEEIAPEVKAIRMPCKHVYHENCIVKWLETSHNCPLCRFKMPCHQSTA